MVDLNNSDSFAPTRSRLPERVRFAFIEGWGWGRWWFPLKEMSLILGQDMWACLGTEKERNFLCSLAQEKRPWDRVSGCVAVIRETSGHVGDVPVQMAVVNGFEVLKLGKYKTLQCWPGPKVVGSKHGCT